MIKRFLSLGLVLAVVATLGPSVGAGGRLETIDITNAGPSPIPGHVLAKVIGIQWDSRSIPVKYVVNSTLDPIPNPLGPPILSVADATVTLQKTLDSWNNIPTSYIDMRIVGTVVNPGLRGFDFKNELTFRTAANFGAIASSPSVSLIADSTLEQGDDIDGDGDSDLSSFISVVTDVDGDGDLEFPAGFYKAGTILDNDVQFNTKTSNGFRFTVADADIDTVPRSADLECVAVHEFGHSFGLSHTLNNQKGRSDGTGAVMFTFIDTGDPVSELAGRRLDSDDIAWASYIYPEGSAASGLAALQAGDIAFTKVYGLLQGAIRHGVLNRPVAGASVAAINRDTGELVATAFSGTTQLSFNRLTGGLFFLPSAADSIVDGAYTIPVPRGNYRVEVEPVDGNPAPAGSISFTAQIGNFHGTLNFNEETYNRNQEGTLEVRPAQDMNVHVNPGKVSADTDVVTNRTLNISNFGNRNFVGFVNSPAGLMYTVRVPRSRIESTLPGQDILVHSALFDTFVLDASTPAVFARALLVPGSVDPTTLAITSLDLNNPLASAEGFLGADDDMAPLHFKNPHELGMRVRREMASGGIDDLFLVLQIPTTTPFAGVSGQAPLIGLDGVPGGANDVPIFGHSYFSNDGGATWIRESRVNFRFALVLAEPPK